MDPTYVKIGAKPYNDLVSKCASRIGLRGVDRYRPATIVLLDILKSGNASQISHATLVKVAELIRVRRDMSDMDAETIVSLCYIGAAQHEKAELTWRGMRVRQMEKYKEEIRQLEREQHVLAHKVAKCHDELLRGYPYAPENPDDAPVERELLVWQSPKSQPDPDNTPQSNLPVSSRMHDDCDESGGNPELPLIIHEPAEPSVESYGGAWSLEDARRALRSFVLKASIDEFKRLSTDIQEQFSYPSSFQGGFVARPERSDLGYFNDRGSSFVSFETIPPRMPLTLNAERKPTNLGSDDPDTDDSKKPEFETILPPIKPAFSRRDRRFVKWG